MHFSSFWKLLFCQFSLLTIGCQQDIPIPTTPVKTDPSEQWQNLLEQSVNEVDGINWANIEAHQDILENYIAWVGTVGPQTNRRSKNRFPRRGRANHKLVHFVNAYNAWMIYSYLYHNKPSNIDNVEVTGGYLWGQRVYIDGEYTSLSHVKHERILADYQEPRLHFMLFDLVENSPTPHFWTADTWKSKVDLMARRFISSGKGARKIGNTWLFHPLFQTYQKDFLDWSEHQNLCTYLDQYTTADLQVWLSKESTNGCNLTFFAESSTIPTYTPSTPSDNSLLEE